MREGSGEGRLGTGGKEEGRAYRTRRREGGRRHGDGAAGRARKEGSREMSDITRGCQTTRHM